MDKKELVDLLIEAQDVSIGCGCGGDYGLCEGCREVSEKIDKVVNSFYGPGD